VLDLRLVDRVLPHDCDQLLPEHPDLLLNRVRRKRKRRASRSVDFLSATASSSSFNRASCRKLLRYNGTFVFCGTEHFRRTLPQIEFHGKPPCMSLVSTAIMYYSVLIRDLFSLVILRVRLYTVFATYDGIISEFLLHMSRRSGNSVDVAHGSTSHPSACYQEHVRTRS